MSSNSNMTVRLSVPLVLAQAAKVGRYVEDARGYVCRLLETPATVKCSSCQQGDVEYRIPINGFRTDRDDDEFDSTRWSVEYDATVAPTSDEADSLDCSTGHTTFRGVRLVSPTFHVDGTRSIPSSENDSRCAHTIDMNTEIDIVLGRLQLAQGAISKGDAPGQSSSFLYASPDCRMTVSVDTTDTFAEHTYDRVDQLLRCCERQFEFFTGCPELTNIMDVFDIIALSSDEGEEEESIEDDDDEWTGRHPFESAIDFAQMPPTLDSAKVTAWIDVVVNTVARCEDAVQSYFDWQLSPDGDFSAPDYSAIDLLRKLGRQQSTIDHFRSRRADRPVQADEAIASATLAVFHDDPLGTLALHVAKTAAADADPEHIRDRIKMKLPSGGYGMFPREHTRKALVAVGAEGVTGAGGSGSGGGC